MKAPKMRSRNPRPLNTKALITASAWAALLFIVLIISTVLESHAANVGKDDDAFTAAEICRQGCDRDYNVCGAGPREVGENYGDNQTGMMVKARCDNDMRECLRQCSTAAPASGNKGPAPSTR
jgi:hypothetical protein